METFPTLSVNPVFPYEEEFEDNVIRSSSEAGYQSSRPRFTRMTKLLRINYKAISQDDKSTLEDFYANVVKGSDSFYWTDIVANKQYIVKFNSPIKFTYSYVGYWDCSIEFKEV